MIVNNVFVNGSISPMGVKNLNVTSGKINSILYAAGIRAKQAESSVRAENKRADKFGKDR